MRLVINFLMLCTFLTLAGCETTPPLTAEQIQQKNANTAAAIKYFSKRIQIVGSLRSYTGGIDEIAFSESNGVKMVNYYKKDVGTPFMQHRVENCTGKVNEGNASIYCDLYDGIHRWVQISIRKVDTDTTVKDQRVLGFASPLVVKSGQFAIYLRMSPADYDFAGVFSESK